MVAGCVRLQRKGSDPCPFGAGDHFLANRGYSSGVADSTDAGKAAPLAVMTTEYCD